MAKNCAICGKPSGMYPLCTACFKLRDAGKIEKCEDCNTWHYTDKPCNCKKEEQPQKEPSQPKKEKSPQNDTEIRNPVVIINENNKSKCITCGKQTEGLLFCSSCYHKYKNKELLFRITQCSNVELLDEDYEGRYTCKDGHIVKSKSERDIDDYLFENGIQHVYEKELPYGPKDDEVLHPDFFLPNYLGTDEHVFIEHWGYNENNIQYTKTKKFKMPIYRKLGITLICTYEKTDTGKIDSVLERKLNKTFIRKGEINNEE